MRHTLSKGKINYWPNRFEVQPAAMGEEGAYVDYPEKVAGIKERAKGPRFSDHTSQTQLFFKFVFQIEKQYLVAALSFALGHCDEARFYE